MKKITNIRKAVCTIANQLRKTGLSLAAAFRAAWKKVKLQMVIRVRKRAGNRREEYINKINQQLSTIKDTWILDQIYRVIVNIMN